MLGLKNILRLSQRTLQLLPISQRKKFWQSVSFGLIIAVLEWFSLAAIIPVMMSLMDVGNGYTPEFLRNVVRGWSPIALVSLVLLIFVVKTYGVLVFARKQLDIADKMYAEFCERTYESYFAQDFVEHTQQATANAFRKIKLTTFDFSHHIVLGLVMLITEASIFTVVTVLLVVIKPVLFIFLIAIGLPTLLFSFLHKRHWTKKIDHSFRELTPRANTVLSQGIESFTEARIYNAERYFIQSFLSISSRTSQLLTQLKTLSILPAKIMEVVGAVIFLCLAIFGPTITSSSDILFIAGLLSIALYKVMPSVIKIANLITQIQSYAYAIDEITDTSRVATSPLKQVRKIPFEKAISISALSFKYPDTKSEVFQNIDFKIKKGDFVVVTGPSGSGKTTLLHVLAGLIKPTQGTIHIDNETLTDEMVPGWQQRIGYVSQAPAIHNDTILNNILFIPDKAVDHPRLQRAIETSGLLSFVTGLQNGLQTQVGEDGMALSGGQRQRLALARALYRNPEVLLLDEVTNQLDQKSKETVLNRLKTLTLEGKTVILSTHDPMARSFATKELRIGGHASINDGDHFPIRS